jgi:hypothetical protein
MLVVGNTANCVRNDVGGQRQWREEKWRFGAKANQSEMPETSSVAAISQSWFCGGVASHLRIKWKYVWRERDRDRNEQQVERDADA